MIIRKGSTGMFERLFCLTVGAMLGAQVMLIGLYLGAPISIPMWATGEHIVVSVRASGPPRR